MHTDAAPHPHRADSQAVVAGADATNHEISADATTEASVLLDNLAAILTAAGADLNQVVRAGIVMRDLQADRPAFNQVWAQRFGDHRPARSAIQAADFGRPGENARYGLEVTAYRG